MTASSQDEKRTMSCQVTLAGPQVLSELGGVSSSLELIGSIDQGTSSTRYIVFNKKGELVASAQMEHTQFFPKGADKVGWHEHDPIEIYQNTCHCVKAAHEALQETVGDEATSTALRAVGITNQRETLVAWNCQTGKPYGNAIVWDDARTTSTARDISHDAPYIWKLGKKSNDALRNKTGLPLASYFSGTKLRWMIEHWTELRNDLMSETERSNVKFGTIDSWLVYNMTGGSSSSKENERVANQGGMHITDVTNASRWLLMDLSTLQWDESLIDIVTGTNNPSIPISSLPSIRSSSEVYGHCEVGCGMKHLEGIPIASILGDQQAALFGQAGFKPGEAKCTYGTGLFLMMNTGDGSPVPSTSGLLTTVAYQLGNDTKPVYALEGSVAFSGSVIQWLRDQLQIIKDAPQSEVEASKVSSNEGLYFVPAFAGLFAPYWRDDARGCIVGMTATHTKSHICRAALEATAYQAGEVFDAMSNDSKTNLKVLKVDGGATANSLLMQFQADMINVPVVAPAVVETTAIGAAFAAGLAVGIWKNLDEIQTMWSRDKIWKPQMPDEDRERYWKGWQKAIQRSFGWAVDEEKAEGLRQNNRSSLLGTIGTVVFAVTFGYMMGKRRQ